MPEDMPEPQPQFQSSTDVKLDYIQRDVREIKDGMKDNINRREFNDALTTIRNQFTEAIKDVQKQISELKSSAAVPDFWQRNKDKAFTGLIILFLMLFYYLLINNGFPKFFIR